jgi:sulfate/thiosulfate-binding protein
MGGTGFPGSEPGAGTLTDAMKRVPLLDIAAVAGVAIAVALIGIKNVQGDTAHEILNVSYDPTVDLYRSLDGQFIAKYQHETGIRLQVKQSHGGSTRQARAVVSGEQQADVVTLGLYSDVDALHKQGLIADDWADRLPHHSQPYYSTIVFVVRKGNPKHIHDWPDLAGRGTRDARPAQFRQWQAERVGRMGCHNNARRD